MITNVLLVLVGLVILSLAADKLVEGASALALKIGVSPLLIGLTIVACGTSMPELVVSVQAGYEGNTGIAIGNVVGSNLFNAALILGLAALIQPIQCSREVIRRDVPIMIGSALLMWYFAWDRRIERIEGACLLVLFVGYNLLAYFQSVKTAQPASPIQKAVDVAQAGVSLAVPGSLDETVGAQPEVGSQPAPAVVAEAVEIPVGTTMAGDVRWILVGLIGLVAGAKMLLAGSVAIAKGFGISDEIIGLTLVAAGTSLPELATSVVAARKGQSEIALGNVVGSNIFNTLGILGVAASLLPLNVSEHMFGIDIPIMVVVCLGCLPIMRTEYLITRLEALILLGAYVGYTYVLFQAPA
jgi:cation:H+ antiporter